MSTRIVAAALALLAAKEIGITLPASLAQRDADAMREATEANNAFGVRLYSQLRYDEGNLVISPVSVETLLAILVAGARGATADDLTEVSGLSPDSVRSQGGFCQLLSVLATPKEGHTVSFDSALALWADSGTTIREPYKHLFQRTYRGLVEAGYPTREANAALARINNWVADHTNNRISQLIPPETPVAESRLLIATAASFVGAWESPFPRDNTAPAPFWVAADKLVDVPLMRQVVEVRTASIDNAKIVELPYQDGAFSFIVVLPNRKDGLSELENRLKEHGVKPWIQALPKERVELEVSVPRFEIDFPRHLIEPLRSLGLREVLDNPADFSGLAEPSPTINHILTRTWIRIDEEGTRAAAAAAGFEGRGAPLSFRADRPFLFMIRDTQTNAILFLGRFVKPPIQLND